MKKKSILLVENDETEIDFFADALEESGLSFSCSTARNIEQAYKILRKSIPDLVFINIHVVRIAGSIALNKLQSLQKTPVILYSAIANQNMQKNNCENLSYVQLPNSIKTMANVFKNLFIENEVHSQRPALM